MSVLSPAEIALIQRSRESALARRAEFMAIANEVCELTGVPFAKVCGVRGDAEVVQTRDLICRIAFERQFHPAIIGRFIRRDRSTVLHSLRKTGKAKAPE